MISLYALLLTLLNCAAPQTLNVEVLVPATGGAIYLAAYDTPEAFDEKEEVSRIIRPATAASQRAELSLEVPAAGEYVIAAFQDLNGNGKLDTNLFGVPTEPYGFAKTPPTKWRAPSFEEIATQVAEGDQLKIELKSWDQY
ncbi:uncharacterized protein (DUF2141 family) [Neolewinella xylanilytica]|uniref:Uncharacterized protein (DUF2141 family) n=1 Tax=Neolewinella xylanilytica TaxID=1514080 RepID=A0A2S6I186_9BACT|nr:DUF2141 domain-containing protein [Neolewinella xylanilytica]PPK84734.1 uncharacterized protein (DUF2141 family) [Neolewinella xylanilytica]